MPSFVPKLAKIAVFGAKMSHFWPQNESEVSETVLSLSALKVDKVCQVPYILDNTKV